MGCVMNYPSVPSVKTSADNCPQQKLQEKFGSKKNNHYLCKKFYIMADKLRPEEVWYLKKMIEISENSLAEGKTYTHEEVKALMKARHNESHLITARVG